MSPAAPKTVAELLSRTLPPRTALELAAALADYHPTSDLEAVRVTTDGTLEGGDEATMSPSEWSGEVGVVLIGLLRGRTVAGRTATSRLAVARDAAFDLERDGRTSPRIVAAVTAAVRLPEETRAPPRDLAEALRAIAEHASGPTLQGYVGLENPEDVATDSFAPITWDDQATAEPATPRPVPAENPAFWPVVIAVAVLLVIGIAVIVKTTML